MRPETGTERADFGSITAVRGGFTLIELLVVIAIIALLIGILLPGLGKARDAARGAVCASSQSQLAKANAAYSYEWKEYNVPIQMASKVPGNNETNWRNHLWPYMGENAAGFDCPAEKFERYADGYSTFDSDRWGARRFRPDPSDRYAYGLVSEKEEFNTSGIGASGWHWGSGRYGTKTPPQMPLWRPRTEGYPEGAAKQGDCQIPSSLIIFGDGGSSSADYFPEDSWWIEWVDGATARQPRKYRGTGFQTFEKSAFRHGGKSNYIKLDGSGSLYLNTEIKCEVDQCWWSPVLDMHKKFPE